MSRTAWAAAIRRGSIPLGLGIVCFVLAWPAIEDLDGQVEEVVLRVHRDDLQDRALDVAAAELDEAEDRDHDVDDPQIEGVAALRRGAVADGEQAERTGSDVDQVVPAVDVEQADHLVAAVVGADRVPRVEAGGVEEPEHADDHEHPADQQRVEPGWT